MGRNERIVINKSYNDSSRITPQSFDAIYGEGQIIISNEYGFEGIYILNTAGDIIRIGYNQVITSGSTADVSEEAKIFVRDYIKAQAFITSSETMEYISVLANALSNLRGEFSAHTASNAADFQELNDKLDNFSGITVEGVTDEHIAEIAELIASQQIDAIVANADEDYNTLKKIADWIKLHPSDPAEVVLDLTEISASTVANTEAISGLSGVVTELAETVGQNAANLDDVSAATEQNAAAIAELSAATVSAIENMGNLPVPSGDTPYNPSGDTPYVVNVDELSASTTSLEERLNALMEEAPEYFDTLKEIKDYIDQQLANVARTGDHVFLSRPQYNYLVEHGTVTISGVTYAYNDDFYYCIYEDDTPYVEPGETSYNYNEETGMIDMNGEANIEDGIVEINGEIDNDGYVSLNESEVEPMVVDEEGFVNIPPSQVDEDGYVEIPDGWEII